ncbi:hypothetical protein FOLKNPGA_02551 [Legionella sp. PC1000]|uniref:hypothetical protein n=1 Tax=Legionella sp. PC1000 TaxID=2746060 RepID=UPI0015F95398|nr:hypothetical protein [Legionella sp. PC1000]QLZ69753.1 hypothetical protein FOLKNPGA_02551 [Legionella sp. PC1000]
MGFYFNTFRQQQGDKAYNEQRYEEALMHYSEALKTLNLHAASNSVRHNDFYDALVYVLSEIVTTRLQLIRREAQDLHFDAIAKYWQDIPGLLQEMELTYKEHLTGLTHFFSNKEQVIKKTHKLLAVVCEEISDELMDQLEDKDEINLNSQEVRSQAIEWMNRAITFQVKTKDSPKLSSSLGYLNLLEQQYKETESETSLHVMSEFIGKYKLLEMPIQSPLRKLELLSYVARLAIFNLEDISELVHECKALYDLLSEEEKENPILDDLQSLVNLIPQEEEEEKEENQLTDMVLTEETPPFSNLDENADYSKEVSVASEKFNFSTDHLDSSMEVQNPSSETTPLFIPTLPSTSPFETSDPVITPQPLSIQSSSQGSAQTSQSFFNTSSQTSSSEEFHPYSKAFQSALDKIISDTSNPKFLANLLSLIADFFGKYKAAGIQKQNAIVLAFDLYQQVLKIDPTHNRACIKLQESSIQHRSLIGPYKFFNGAQNHTAVATQISAAKACFKQTLEELTVQLESLLMNQPGKMRITIDLLICFIEEQLRKGAITLTPNLELAKMLTDTFEIELKNSAYPGAILEKF